MADTYDRTVIVAVDASEHSENAFKYYVDHLYLPKSQVILLHCPELSNVTARMSKGEKPPYEEWETIWAEEQKNWAKLQETYEAYLANKNISGTFEVSPSSNHKPGENIVKYATEKNATMIVMGTRGLGSIRRTIMGSVSDFVVHHAHCPVIVCRPKEKH